MSFWDQYLAPGDLRAAHQRQHQQPSPTTTPSKPTKPIPIRADAATRQRRQDALLYGGLAFTCLSAIITRRTLMRKRAPTPSTFTPSNAPPPPVNGGFEAVEALGLATLNVFSLAMLSVGGFMTYFDVADIEDMRDQVRRGVGYDVYGGDSEADHEIEAWVADVLSRKDEGGGGFGALKGGIAEKLRELEEIDQDTMEGRRNKAQETVAMKAPASVPMNTGNGWLSGWFESKPAYDPSTSSNPYINGTKEARSALCLRCGQPGHAAANCLYSALSAEERTYLSSTASTKR